MNSITPPITAEVIETAKLDYENEGVSFATLAKRYGKNHTFWWRKAKKEGWTRKEQNNKNADSKANVTPADSITPGKFDGILDAVAVRKIKEIVEELGDKYSKVDEPLLVAYAKSYQYFLKLSREIDATGISLISPKTGALYTNPAFNSWLAVTNNIAKLGERIGVSVAARKRIGLVLGADDKTESLFDFIEKISEEDVDL